METMRNSDSRIGKKSEYFVGESRRGKERHIVIKRLASKWTISKGILYVHRFAWISSRFRCCQSPSYGSRLSMSTCKLLYDFFCSHIPLITIGTNVLSLTISQSFSLSLLLMYHVTTGISSIKQIYIHIPSSTDWFVFVYKRIRRSIEWWIPIQSK